MTKIIITDSHRQAFDKVLFRNAGRSVFRVDLGRQAAVVFQTHIPENVMGKLLAEAKEAGRIKSSKMKWVIRSNQPAVAKP